MGWAVLLVAVLNFAPAQFSSSYLADPSTWMRLVKDVPLVLLVAALGWQLLRHRPAWHLSDIRGLLARVSVRVFARDAPVGSVLATLVVLLALLAGFMLVSTAATGAGPLGSFVSARYYVLYPALALLLALSGPFEVKHLAVGMVILGAMQTGLAVADYAGWIGPTFYAWHVEYAGHIYPRAIGTLGNPNNLGLFLGLASLVVLGSGAWGTRRGKLALAVLVLGIILTGSKTALIALALAGLLSRPLRARQWSWRRIALLSGALVACMLAIVVMASQRLGAERSLSGALGTHGESARLGFESWFESPASVLFGQGFDAQATVTAGGEVQENPVDTMALAVAVEGGLVALVGVAIVVALGCRLIWMQSRRSVLGTIGRGFAILMVVYAVISVSFRLFPGALLFWIVVGLCASSVLRRDLAPQEPGLRA